MAEATDKSTMPLLGILPPEFIKRQIYQNIFSTSPLPLISQRPLVNIPSQAPTFLPSTSPAQSPPVGQLSTAPVLWATSPVFASIPQEEITQAVRTALAGLTRPAPQIGWGQIMKAALLSSLIPAGAGLLTGLISGLAGSGATPGAQVFAGLSPAVTGAVQGALTRAQWEQQQYAQQLQNYWNMLDFLSKIFTPYVPSQTSPLEEALTRAKIYWYLSGAKVRERGSTKDWDKYFNAEKKVIRSSLESFNNPYYNELAPLRKDEKLFNKYISALAYYNLADYPDIPPEKAKEYIEKANKALTEVEKEIAKKNLPPEQETSLLDIITTKVKEFIKQLSPALQTPLAPPPEEEDIEVR